MVIEVGTLGRATGVVTAASPAVPDALEREGIARGRAYRSLMRKWWFGAAVGVVKGGYTPDAIVVERGKPVRLSFIRQESAACSEMVLLPAFGKSAHLPEGETVAVEFMPTEPGTWSRTTG